MPTAPMSASWMHPSIRDSMPAGWRPYRASSSAGGATCCNMRPMGFYLWVDDGLAWAQGTYEYRPMGTAVISASDLFRRRDFDPRRKVRAPARSTGFVGQFAFLGQVNAQLRSAYCGSKKARASSTATGQPGRVGSLSRPNRFQTRTRDSQPAAAAADDGGVP